MAPSLVHLSLVVRHGSRGPSTKCAEVLSLPEDEWSAEELERLTPTGLAQSATLGQWLGGQLLSKELPEFTAALQDDVRWHSSPSERVRLSGAAVVKALRESDALPVAAAAALGDEPYPVLPSRDEDQLLMNRSYPPYSEERIFQGFKHAPGYQEAASTYRKGEVFRRKAAEHADALETVLLPIVGPSALEHCEDEDAARALLLDRCSYVHEVIECERFWNSNAFADAERADSPDAELIGDCDSDGDDGDGNDDDSITDVVVKKNTFGGGSGYSTAPVDRVDEVCENPMFGAQSDGDDDGDDDEEDDDAVDGGNVRVAKTKTAMHNRLDRQSMDLVEELAVWCWESRFVTFHNGAWAHSLGGPFLDHIVHAAEPSGLNSRSLRVWAAHDYSILSLLAVLGCHKYPDGGALSFCATLGFEVWEEENTKQGDNACERPARWARVWINSRPFLTGDGAKPTDQVQDNRSVVIDRVPFPPPRAPVFCPLEASDFSSCIPSSNRLVGLLIVVEGRRLD